MTRRRAAGRRVSGIVLAGGASRRFGSDKLDRDVDGGPLLERAVAAVAAVSSEVIVVVAPGDERALPAAERAGPPRADPETHGGPLVGLLAGLEAAREPLAIVAGGDMPTLSADVLAALVRALAAAEGAADAAVLVRAAIDGRCRPSSATAPRPRPPAGSSPRASEASRAPSRSCRRGELEEAEWRGLDPDGATLRDVDVPRTCPRPERRTDGKRKRPPEAGAFVGGGSGELGRSAPVGVVGELRRVIGTLGRVGQERPDAAQGYRRSGCALAAGARPSSRGAALRLRPAAR